MTARVPTLHPCPDCGVLLQKVKTKGAPYGLAFHACTELTDATRRDIVRRINEAVVADVLTRGETQEMLFRLILAKAIEEHASLADLAALYKQLGEDGTPTTRRSSAGAAPKSGSLLEALVAEARGDDG